MGKVEEEINSVECSVCLGCGELWLVVGDNPCSLEVEEYPCAGCSGKGRVPEASLVHDRWKRARQSVARDNYEQFVLPLVGTLVVFGAGLLGYAAASFLVPDVGRLWSTFVFVGWSSLGAMLLFSMLDSILARKSALRHSAAEKAWSLLNPEPPCSKEKNSMEHLPGS